MKHIEMARFDTRIPLEQKEFFEYAATLGGFRTLTEFVIYSAKIKAEEIVDKHNSILASKKDKEIFFNALVNPAEPNDSLKDAFKKHKKAVAK